jgi:hypothetical protein
LLSQDARFFPGVQRRAILGAGLGREAALGPHDSFLGYGRRIIEILRLLAEQQDILMRSRWSILY